MKQKKCYYGENNFEKSSTMKYNCTQITHIVSVVVQLITLWIFIIRAKP